MIAATLRLVDAPDVCDIRETAALLRRSVTSIEVDLALGVMKPDPLPVLSHTVKGRPRRNLKRQWSRFAIEAWLSGGYLQFIQAAAKRSAQAKPARRYFGSVNGGRR